MLSSRFTEYAQAADDLGCEIVGCFERDELATKHAVTLLLWHDSKPHWSINDATIGGKLSDNDGYAAIHEGVTYDTAHEAAQEFSKHAAQRFAPCPFDHPSSHSS